MKIACKPLKGVCLLLLGLAATGGARSFAAEVISQNFTTLSAESSAVTATDAPGASPFKDESIGMPEKAVPVEPDGPLFSPSCPAETAVDCDSFNGAPGQFWFRGEFLYWWTSGAHLPPMVSTVTNLNNPTGSLATVFGGRDIRDGSHDGYRMDFGMWLDCSHCWGLEADYFDLTGRPDNYDSGVSNGFANGNPFPIVRAFYDPGTTNIGQGLGQPIGITLSGVAYPNQYVGRITVDTGDYFQSAGIWLRRELRSSEWSTSNSDVNWTDRSARTFRLDAIAGYRFTRLIDFVNERDQEMDINAASGSYLTEFTFADTYGAVNNFNGGELGWNAVYTFGRWSLDIVDKIALGVNNQDVKLNGLEVVDASNTGGGIQQSVTSQEYSRNRFSVIPELMVTAGYQVTDHLKFTAGYDLLYWTAVVRAADQIATQPTTGLPYGSLSGSTLPPFAFNESHFLAQGIHLGGEFRF